MAETENFRPYNRNELNTCIHVSEDERVKTESKPYRKNFCIKCSAWTYSEKNPLQISFGTKQPQGTKNHIHTKRIMNQIVEAHQKDLKKYESIPEDLAENLYVETEFMKRRYHIPVKYVIIWAENSRRGDVILDILDKMTTVRR